MRPPPSLRKIPRYPVTTAVAGAALAVTALWWSGRDVERVAMTSRVWARWELWRALTCTLPHANVMHLAFNLCRLWVFGTCVEQVYGHLKTAAIFSLLALGSSLWEFALLDGGVGLSGVGYGLWGMLWMFEQCDARFTDAVDLQTSRVFVFWFFLCIAMTLVGWMAVANVAHGVGAGMGALVGVSVVGHGVTTWLSSVGLAWVVALGLVGSTVWWDRFNISQNAEAGVEHDGVEALNGAHAAQGLRLLEIATRMRRPPAHAWYNLGVAYHQLGRYEAALAAYEHAAGMPDASSEMHQAAQEMASYLKARQP